MRTPRFLWLAGLLAAALSMPSAANICKEVINIANPWSAEVQDQWSSSCNSIVREDTSDPYNPKDALANFYTFTLERDADIRIDVSSGYRDYTRRTYLREGDTTSGDTLITSYGDVIKKRLSPGTYTLEISHIYTRNYTYRVAFDDVGQTSECDIQLIEGVEISDGWISDCQSVSRDMADPYNTIPDEGHRARFLTFSLDQDSDVSFTVDSDVDTHMYLLEGTGEFAVSMGVEFSENTFFKHLTKGSYTIEPTRVSLLSPKSISFKQLLVL